MKPKSKQKGILRGFPIKLDFCQLKNHVVSSDFSPHRSTAISFDRFNFWFVEREIWCRDDDWITLGENSIIIAAYPCLKALAQLQYIDLDRNVFVCEQKVHGKIIRKKSELVEARSRHDVHYSTNEVKECHEAFLHKLSNNRPMRPFVCINTE